MTIVLRSFALDAGQIEALPDYIDINDFGPPAARSVEASQPSTNTSNNKSGTTPYVPFSSTITWQSKESATASIPDQAFSPCDRSDRGRNRQQEQPFSHSRSRPSYASTTSQRNNVMMTCPKCGKTMKEHELPEHFQTEHKRPSSGASRITAVAKIAQQPSPGRTLKAKQAQVPELDGVCPVCGAKLRTVNIVKHMRKCHPVTGLLGAVKSTPGALQGGSIIIDIDDDEYAFLDGDMETIIDEFYDQRYGDKYVGQSWPESSGQYGSIPLYDDYGDEGEA